MAPSFFTIADESITFQQWTIPFISGRKTEFESTRGIGILPAKGPNYVIPCLLISMCRVSLALPS
jgi:hypothetical protein